MSRRKATAKQAVELYLIIVGGAYTLAAIVATLSNMHWLLTSTDRDELRTVRSDIGENATMLFAAGATLIAGIGIYKYRPWGLVLAATMGGLAILESLHASAIDPMEYHNLIIGLPMAAIMIWALLPATWAKFKQGSVRAS